MLVLFSAPPAFAACDEASRAAIEAGEVLEVAIDPSGDMVRIRTPDGVCEESLSEWSRWDPPSAKSRPAGTSKPAATETVPPKALAPAPALPRAPATAREALPPKPAAAPAQARTPTPVPAPPKPAAAPAEARVPAAPPAPPKTAVIPFEPPRAPAPPTPPPAAAGDVAVARASPLPPAIEGPLASTRPAPWRTSDCVPVSAYWSSGNFRIAGKIYNLARIFTIDHDGDTVVDNVGFILESTQAGALIVRYHARPGMFSAKAVSGLRLDDESVVGQLCFGELTFPKVQTVAAMPVMVPFRIPNLAAQAREKEVLAQPAAAPAAPPPRSVPALPLAIHVIGIVGLVVVAGGAIAFFILRRRRLQEPLPPLDDEAQEDAEEGTEEVAAEEAEKAET